MSLLERIKEIEEEMARTQKNKATAKHLGMLKAKHAKLKRELIEGSSKSGGGGGADAFEVRRTGDVRVGFVGFPSVGKSTLLNKLTNTFSEVGAYEFTTLTCVPGVMYYKGAKVQLLDLPGIIEGAKDGKGRGRQVISSAKTCDLIFIVLDALKPLGHKKIIENELEGFGIRLNKQPPKLSFRKKDKGGLAFSYMGPGKATHLDHDTVRTILDEYKIHNADVILREDCTADQLIDVIEGNRVYTPCLYVLNKIDAITIEELDVLDSLPHCVPISANHMWNLDGLLARAWTYMRLVRIYTKPKGEIPDYSAPVVLKEGKATVGDFCDAIHKSIRKNFHYANVWGRSVQHSPQRVGLTHVLCDEDLVQLVKRSG